MGILKRKKDRSDPVDETLSSLSRRGFLKISAGLAAGMAAMSGVPAWGKDEYPLVIMEQATGMIVGDPLICVSCQMCESACTAFNDGKVDPALSRVKIARNFNFGATGTPGRIEHGVFGDGLVIQDTCRQCPHPVPCATVCPQNAIVAQKDTGTRIVLEDKCVGCKLCQKACPWGMMTFDRERGVSSKCFLCNGAPKCVEICPAGALRFIPWNDRTKLYQTRGSFMISVPPDKQESCNSCHVNAPGGPRSSGWPIK